MIPANRFTAELTATRRSREWAVNQGSNVQTWIKPAVIVLGAIPAAEDNTTGEYVDTGTNGTIAPSTHS